MKKKAEIIISLASTFIFFYLTSYVSILGFEGLAAGATTIELLFIGMILLVSAGFTVFSLIFAWNYFKAHYIIQEKLIGANTYGD